MIIQRHPDYIEDREEHLPGFGALRAIGYWHSDYEPGLPDPEAFVDRSWDADERTAVIAYLRGGKEYIAWRGLSWCRFNCGIDDVAMGFRCLTDGTFIWPEGFAHYLEVHAVRPPDEFVRHVLARAR